MQQENGNFELQLMRNDSRINSHSPFVAIHWRANTDFQPIISMDSVVNYIAKYASKAESASDSLSEIQNLLSSVRTQNLTTTSIVQRVLIKQCGERDYSAQECIWVALGFPFYSSSRKFVIINLSPDAFVPIDTEENADIVQPQNPERIYASRLIDFEVAKSRGRRGQNDQEQQQQRNLAHQTDAENMSMFNFFSTYYKRPRNAVAWSLYNKKPII